MAFVYALVARERTVLAEWSDRSGNFGSLARMLQVPWVA
jgi:hypothetical protein